MSDGSSTPSACVLDEERYQVEESGDEKGHVEWGYRVRCLNSEHAEVACPGEAVKTRFRGPFGDVRHSRVLGDD